MTFLLISFPRQCTLLIFYLIADISLSSVVKMSHHSCEMLKSEKFISCKVDIWIINYCKILTNERAVVGMKSRTPFQKWHANFSPDDCLHQWLSISASEVHDVYWFPSLYECQRRKKRALTCTSNKPTALVFVVTNKEVIIHFSTWTVSSYNFSPFPRSVRLWKDSERTMMKNQWPLKSEHGGFD